MNFGELFVGIGGFRFGLEKANQMEKCVEPFEGIGSLQGRCDAQFEDSPSSFACVWANDWDKYACQIYRKHYGTKELVEADITTINPDSIPDFELLTAGFPCQSFSLAGKRKGFQDIRGTMFHEVVRVARAKRPKLLLLENVKGLLSNDQGRTFGTILEELGNIGYWCEWQTLNSKHFGVPQNRERVFIVGHLRTEPSKQIFPVGFGSSETARSIQEAQGERERISAAILDKPDRHTSDYIIEDGSENLILAVETAYTKANMKEGRFSEVCHSLDGGKSKAVLERSRIRRLTPTECERLQGFPDGWTEGVSDTQRYKLLGNAVTTNVITFLGHKLLEMA